MQLRAMGAAAILGTWVAAAAEVELPEGNGKEIVENTCADCHTLRRITIQRLDEEGWNSILREMTENGASINPDDLKVLSEYLSKNFGLDRKVNVNHAEADELATALHLTAEQAKAIIAYRTRRGAIKDLATLEKAAGAPDRIEARKELVEF